MTTIDLSPLWISLKVSTVATVITFFAGTAAAYGLLGYRGKWRSLLDTLFISPLVLPPTVVGFVLLQFFGSNGWGGQLLRSLNIEIIFTWYAGAIAATVVTFPLMYRTALGAFEQIDSNLLHAARTLGASEFRIFWQVSLPLALPGVLAGITLSFARGLGEFGATLMLAGNIPGETETIPLAIYAAVEAGATDQAWFWSLIILSISLVAIPVGIIARIATINLLTTAPLTPPPLHPSTSPPLHNSKLKTQNSKLTPPLQPSLTVDIQSYLASFSLQLTFDTDRHPLGILGASGAGKSLLLRCIAGIETPDHGRIVLNGRVLSDSKLGINIASRDRRIGIIFQHYALFPHLTVAQNVAFGLAPKKNSRHRIEAQLQTVELTGLGDRYPHQLSGGQQQRVALARALICDPDVLLLDEPFSALDTHLRFQMEQELIATLNTYSGITLFVTHNLEEAYRVCKNLLILEQGRAIAHADKHTIFEHPNLVSIAKLTGCKNFSRAKVNGFQQIDAIDWNCTLQVIDPPPAHFTQVAIRAHHLQFVDPDLTPALNTFPCWVAATSETPHRMTVFLKLQSAPLHASDYHLQAEVFKEKWETLKNQPLPWYVHFNPQQLILLED
ncbi:molybdate ABC transporter permease subunit [Leptolyngbyaceae cyanobacterium UHCC 1019]